MSTATIEQPKAASRPKRRLNRIQVPYLPTPEPERVRALRLELGLTHKQMAKLLHLYDAQAATRYERTDEAGESGYSLHPCAWDLLNLYHGTNPKFVLVNREVAEALGLPKRPKLDSALES
jgi:transcriptional regulator with XRE-family HTH domain